MTRMNSLVALTGCLVACLCLPPVFHVSEILDGLIWSIHFDMALTLTKNE